MKKLIRLIVLFELASLAFFAVASNAQGNGQGNPRPKFGSTLLGKHEVPAIVSPGRGRFSAQVTADGAALDYTLDYRDVGVVDQAHIHVGQPGVNGGVAAFLCGGGSTPACPDNEGEVSGTIIALDVVGPAGQGVAAEDFDALILALRRGIGYVNVHTADYPGGELRGKVRPGGGGGNGNGRGNGPPN